MPASSTTAIRRAIGFIGNQQRSDGGFNSYSSSSLQNFSASKTYQTTFVPSLVLAALASSGAASSQTIRDKIADFLLTQARPPQYSFNYWAKNSQAYTKQPYPDDLDDTFCALSALYVHDNSRVSEAMLAGMVKMLLATETAAGGPYRTWLVPNTSQAVWLDVDLAVNANIAYFLSLVGASVPRLTSYIDRALEQGHLHSPYYPSSYPLLYFISRGYRGTQQLKLRSMLLEKLRAAKNPLEQALCLVALDTTGYNGDTDSFRDQLLVSQHGDGSWPAYAFCIDPSSGGTTFYHGAAVLTTALVIEALLAQPANSKPTVDTISKPKKSAEWIPVMALASKQCRKLQPAIKTTTLKALERIVKGSNGREIISLARLFNDTLVEPLEASDDLLQTLGLANAYGWLAYTIYDDFLDGEGQPHLLPTANVAMRNSLYCFSSALPTKPAFQQLVNDTFDIIDGANAWEQTYARAAVSNQRITLPELPDYADGQQLAERSLGHSLSPLAVLVAKGIEPKDEAFGQLQQAFRHYLIARQLNDDAHDWQQDLERGQLSYVVSQILRELAVPTGSCSLPELLVHAQKQFWHTTLPSISQQMLAQISRSRTALTASGLCQEHNILLSLLDSITAQVQETLAKQQQTVRFLEYYQASEG